MEDDDEFGDLYTDVLQPFASSSSAPQPHHSSPAPPSIDLNLNAPEIPYAAPHSNSPARHPSSDQIAPPEIRESTPATAASAAAIDGSDDAPGEPRVDKQEKSAEGARVLDGGDAEFAEPDSNGGKEWIAGCEAEAKGDDLMDKDVKFDIEDDDGDGIGSEPVIPGLSTDAAGGSGGDGPGDLRRVDRGGEGGDDDWDSDSDDDLQIVLNDNSHTAMERGGMVGDGDDDDEDEDGGLVIVADGDPNQGVEEQDWGENTALPADGERKDAGELAKAGGSAPVMQKIGYSNHGYHPFHSQYKVSVLSWLKSSYLCLGFHFIV